MRSDEYKNIFLHQTKFWWYRGMAAILARLLSGYLPKGTKPNILDAGCGTGAAFPILRPFGSVTGVDISTEALSYAKKIGEKTKKGSVTSLPFLNESFDVVVSLDVLYHTWVDDYHKALREYVRVLAPGGIFLWREPAYEWLKSGHDLVDYTERRFTIEQMKKSLQELPMEIKKLSYLNTILFPIVIVKRLPAILHLEKPRAKSDINSDTSQLNSILSHLLTLESYLIPYVSLPFGSSVICVAQKV